MKRKANTYCRVYTEKPVENKQVLVEGTFVQMYPQKVDGKMKII